VTQPEYEVEVHGFWDGLGTDEAGMPVHLPMPLTADGQGPAFGDEIASYACWCGRLCPLHMALREAWLAGLRLPIDAE